MGSTLMAYPFKITKIPTKNSDRALKILNIIIGPYLRDHISYNLLKDLEHNLIFKK